MVAMLIERVGPSLCDEPSRLEVSYSVTKYLLVEVQLAIGDHDSIPLSERLSADLCIFSDVADWRRVSCRADSLFLIPI